jgi:hypothetical protein
MSRSARTVSSIFREAAGATEEWHGCSLFPGKLINVNGWCASWTLKAG